MRTTINKWIADHPSIQIGTIEFAFSVVGSGASQYTALITYDAGG